MTNPAVHKILDDIGGKLYILLFHKKLNFVKASIFQRVLILFPYYLLHQINLNISSKAERRGKDFSCGVNLLQKKV